MFVWSQYHLKKRRGPISLICIKLVPQDFLFEELSLWRHAFKAPFLLPPEETARWWVDAAAVFLAHVWIQSKDTKCQIQMDKWPLKKRERRNLPQSKIVFKITHPQRASNIWRWAHNFYQGFFFDKGGWGAYRNPISTPHSSQRQHCLRNDQTISFQYQLENKQRQERNIHYHLSSLFGSV